jgi:hypothetical protein
MGGSSGGGSSTTRVEPPRYQLPYLEHGLGQARSLYDTNPQVAGFSGETELGLQGISGMAQRGNPITGSANNLAQQTLNGDFMGANPYLDQTFNRAALQTQNQLSSEFARSGRNVDASQGLRSQQLNDLATGIYGGAYDAERNRQQQVLGMSPQLGAASYQDYDRLLGVGAQREGLQQEQMDQPGRNLDQYLQRVGGNYGQTTIAPSTRNRAAGALGGGMMGSQLGGQIGSQWGGNGSTWGQIGGGILGGYLGGWG